jgi:hypothetical protein
VRVLLAGAGGSALFHVSEGPVAARNRCCRRERRHAKEFCLSIGGGCKLGSGSFCTKLGHGECEYTIDCEGGDPAVCP